MRFKGLWQRRSHCRHNCGGFYRYIATAESSRQSGAPQSPSLLQPKGRGSKGKGKGKQKFCSSHARACYTSVTPTSSDAGSHSLSTSISPSSDAGALGGVSSGGGPPAAVRGRGNRHHFADYRASRSNSSLHEVGAAIVSHLAVTWL